MAFAMKVFDPNGGPGSGRWEGRPSPSAMAAHLSCFERRLNDFFVLARRAGCFQTVLSPNIYDFGSLSLARAANGDGNGSSGSGGLKAAPGLRG